MIKALQKKFVMTAMTAISVLLLLLLGAINLANIVMVGRQTDNRLDMISQNEGNPENLRMIPEEPAPKEPFRRKNEYDTFISSNYFVARFDGSGSLKEVDVSRMTSISKEEAQNTAMEIYANGKEKGTVKQLRYRVVTHPTKTEKTIVFLDITGEILSYLRILALSLIVGAAGWGAMLLLVIFLSRKAIRPIAANIEKQKQFVTNAGHEIKTPLAIIRTNAEAMELYQGETKWSKNIKEQTDRLNDLTKNLLTLARMDEYTEKQTAVLNLSDLTSEKIRHFSESFRMKHILVKTEIEPDIEIKACEEHMEQLLSVLFDNAVKYTNENGWVGVRLKKTEKTVSLEIRNTCELPQVSAEKLLERFYRADEARTQKTGGFGIGLSVAKTITENNNGTLTVCYEGDDVICFRIAFP